MPWWRCGIEREVDHHDGVLLHDADQQHDADGGNQRQVLTETASGWQARPQPPRAGRPESVSGWM